MGVAAHRTSPLRATSLLADNSWPILESVATELRAAGVDVDVQRDIEPEDADIVFACGLLTRDLIAAGVPLEIVAAPIFPDETAPVYRSVIVVRSDDDLDLSAAARRRFGVNDFGSWSGWHAYLVHLADHGLGPPREEQRHETGGHLHSMHAVVDGTCDVAAIDSSVWRHHRRDREGLAVIDTTRDWPAPPISVGPGIDGNTRAALVTVPGLVATTAATYDELFDIARRVN